MGQKIVLIQRASAPCYSAETNYKKIVFQTKDNILPIESFSEILFELIKVWGGFKAGSSAGFHPPKQEGCKTSEMMAQPRWKLLPPLPAPCPSAAQTAPSPQTNPPSAATSQLHKTFYSPLRKKKDWEGALVVPERPWPAGGQRGERHSAGSARPGEASGGNTWSRFSTGLL